MRQYKILWIDDEIDMLKSHIYFLEEKGCSVTPVNNGLDAIDLFVDGEYDIIFVDETMPGISGLETLHRIKKIDPAVPVVMITKNEDEGIMSNAIGMQISDYLIKPVNPNQILLCLKKNLQKSELVSENVMTQYREQFTQLTHKINTANSADEWVKIYKELTDWELKLSNTKSLLSDSLLVQKQEANTLFARFIKANYSSWIQQGNGPLLSHRLLKEKILPPLEDNEKVLFVVIDNFRYDQWMKIKKMLSRDFRFSEEYCYSILPTVTQYARNSLFSGLLPKDIKKLYPQYWTSEADDDSKNNYELELLNKFFERERVKKTISYEKVSLSGTGGRHLSHVSKYNAIDLNVLVVNFIDILSHARTESKMIRQLAPNESSYRSVTKAWFEHSGLIEIFKKYGKLGFKIILTSDHGMIRVKKPQKILGGKNLNLNLRYKTGQQIQYDRKKVFEILKPEEIGLPSAQLNTRYIFAFNEDFFVYPNDFQTFVSYYTDTFQHGGISMEEIIVPLIQLSIKDE